MILKNDWWELNANLDNLPTPQARAQLLRDNLQSRKTAVEVLNFFEEMAVAIHTEAVDQEVLKRFFRSLVRVYWDRYSFWIHSLRKNADSPRAYVELEKMVTKWKEDQLEG